MKNLVRGGLILSALSLCVVFIYAQTQMEENLIIANDSQIQLNNIENTVTSEINLIENDNKQTQKTNTKKEADKATQTNKEQKAVKETETQENEQEQTGNKVKKTVSSKAVGVSKGRFVATAYCLRGRTASGAQVRKGLIAADPRVLRLGTRVNLGAGAYSGNYLVADTGGKIKGNKIDIWMASCAEARRFGRRNVTLSILD
ncbi:MAG: 3D domain-containing protein [Acidobacteria bacterium]|nr:3D domain-containing protein [Acidobacteriota bacterium]